MQTAVFYGASDDLIEIEGVKGGDEFSVYSSERHYKGPEIHGQFNLGGKMRIYAIYDGCWCFAVSKVDENIALPDWPCRVVQRAEHGTAHSTQLEIDVPDDVKVFREGG